MVRVAVLDDYQGVALESAEWGSLPADTSVEPFRDHLDDEEALARRLLPFDVIMAMRERTSFTRTLLARLPNLKLLATTGMRNAAIDLEAATDLGIVVCGTGGGPPGRGGGRATAELTWALILAMARRLPQEYNATRAGAWQQTLGVALEGKVLGIVGLGNIGAQVAEVGRAFHMELIAWSTNLTEERAAACGARRVSKAELLSQADFVTIHLQLSERTRSLLTAADLATMKATAYLINTSRGPIVDEDALVKVLQRRSIAGAGLDVFGREPLPLDHPFRRLDNVAVTPHLGYVTEDTYRGSFFPLTVENIAAWLAGAPTRVLNPAALPGRRPA